MRPYTVFFAFQFDPATYGMYDAIRGALANDPEFASKFSFQIGFDSVISETPDELEIDAFKAQNADLLTRFRSIINTADIVIADMTNDNPNVHIELGIALVANKNILRVYGRGMERIASDIRGLVVNPYRDPADLQDRIKRYLRQFLRIKDLPLSPESDKFFREFSNERELQSRLYQSELSDEVLKHMPRRRPRQIGIFQSGSMHAISSSR